MLKLRQPPRSWLANLPIRRKIALPLMAALAVMLISVVLYFPQRHTQTLRQAYWREASRMAEAIVVAVALALEAHNYALLEQTVSAMRLDNNVSCLFLFDEAGDSLVAYNPGHVAFALAANGVSDDHIMIRREIGNQEQQPFGALLLGYSLEDMHRQAREYRIATFAFTTIAFVLGLIFINQISQRITQPISRLHAQMQAIIAQGSYDGATTTAFTDEIGSLAEVFNRMMSELQSRHERLRESQEKYRQLYEKLKELDRLKSNFVSDASHHLRTPLTIIIGEIEVALRQLRDIDEYRETLGIIEDEAKYLGKIVDNLLTLAKADAGSLIVPQPDVDVAAICENEVKRAGILAKSKNLRLESRIARDCLITADPNRLAELIFNLLENAVKYTPAGKSITVTLENAPDNVVLQVADTGPGIPREDWERIFDRFYRGKLFSKKAKGAGLGLAICASIIKAHGGTISVSSRLGEGSIFTVTLPRQAETAQDLLNVATDSENKSCLISDTD
ncbi:MAG: HAMP domain-containing histidine kinase [candidate division KSB1 bacterium]|nr:HAMP domain-containing histidine kinase [candidate division KSB1 bacterium]MDZ7364327.1 HAMP domain-containing histidine kinase [candidate division KSB1 bacterium]MDZ7402699.1 HAMP domain-containing histidine kinase [candidate division KSB1 bacterium]